MDRHSDSVFDSDEQLARTESANDSGTAPMPVAPFELGVSRHIEEVSPAVDPAALNASFRDAIDRLFDAVEDDRADTLNRFLGDVLLAITRLIDLPSAVFWE